MAATLQKAAFRSGSEITIYLDLNRGVKARLVTSTPIRLDAGSTLRIYLRARPPRSTVGLYPTSVEADALLGQTLHAGDEGIQLSVLAADDDSLVVEAIGDSLLKPSQSLTSSETHIGLGPMNHLNQRYLSAASDGLIDCVMLSFVDSPTDVAEATNALREAGLEHVKVASKIETRASMNHLDQILSVTDSVVIARGDLAIQLGVPELPSAQFHIADLCRARGTPFIVATQAFESGIARSMPSRGEIIDVGVASALGAHALMLGRETCMNPDFIGLIDRVSAILSETGQRSRLDYYGSSRDGANGG